MRHPHLQQPYLFHQIRFRLSLFCQTALEIFQCLFHIRHTDTSSCNAQSSPALYGIPWIVFLSGNLCISRFYLDMIFLRQSWEDHPSARIFHKPFPCMLRHCLRHINGGTGMTDSSGRTEQHRRLVLLGI